MFLSRIHDLKFYTNSKKGAAEAAPSIFGNRLKTLTLANYITIANSKALLSLRHSQVLWLDQQHQS